MNSLPTVYANQDPYKHSLQQLAHTHALESDKGGRETAPAREVHKLNSSAPQQRKAWIVPAVAIAAFAAASAIYLGRNQLSQFFRPIAPEVFTGQLTLQDYCAADTNAAACYSRYNLLETQPTTFPTPNPSVDPIDVAATIPLSANLQENTHQTTTTQPTGIPKPNFSPTELERVSQNQASTVNPWILLAIGSIIFSGAYIKNVCCPTRNQRSAKPPQIAIATPIVTASRDASSVLNQPSMGASVGQPGPDKAKERQSDENVAEENEPIKDSRFSLTHEPVKPPPSLTPEEQAALKQKWQNDPVAMASALGKKMKKKETRLQTIEQQMFDGKTLHVKTSKGTKCLERETAEILDAAGCYFGKAMDIPSNGMWLEEAYELSKFLTKTLSDNVKTEDDTEDDLVNDLQNAIQKAQDFFLSCPLENAVETAINSKKIQKSRKKNNSEKLKNDIYFEFFGKQSILYKVGNTKTDLCDEVANTLNICMIYQKVPIPADSKEFWMGECDRLLAVAEKKNLEEFMAIQVKRYLIQMLKDLKFAFENCAIEHEAGGKGAVPQEVSLLQT